MSSELKYCRSEASAINEYHALYIICTRIYMTPCYGTKNIVRLVRIHSACVLVCVYSLCKFNHVILYGKRYIRWLKKYPKIILQKSIMFENYSIQK